MKILSSGHKADKKHNAMTQGEIEFAAMKKADLEKIAEEIGAHFGYSSAHAIAFDGLMDELETLSKAANEVLRVYMPQFNDSRAVDDCLVGLAAAVSGFTARTCALVAAADGTCGLLADTGTKHET